MRLMRGRGDSERWGGGGREKGGRIESGNVHVCGLGTKLNWTRECKRGVQAHVILEIMALSHLNA